MPKLIAKRYDPDAPGSHNMRKRIWGPMVKFQRRYNAALAGDDEASMDFEAIYDVLTEAMIPHLEMDDGSDVRGVLETLSANEYDSLINEVFGGVVEETVPPATASS